MSSKRNKTAAMSGSVRRWSSTRRVISLEQEDDARWLRRGGCLAENIGRKELL
jgi:hypothetical protein